MFSSCAALFVNNHKFCDEFSIYIAQNLQPTLCSINLQQKERINYINIGLWWIWMVDIKSAEDDELEVVVEYGGTGLSMAVYDGKMAVHPLVYILYCL